MVSRKAKEGILVGLVAFLAVGIGFRNFLPSREKFFGFFDKSEEYVFGADEKEKAYGEFLWEAGGRDGAINSRDNGRIAGSFGYPYFDPEKHSLELHFGEDKEYFTKVTVRERESGRIVYDTHLDRNECERFNYFARE